jgi:multicomponent Na+:H+ antiporter subunit G
VGLTVEPAHWTATVKLLVIIFFLYVTTATANHALAHAAFTSGLAPYGSEENDQGTQT